MERHYFCLRSDNAISVGGEGLLPHNGRKLNLEFKWMVIAVAVVVVPELLVDLRNFQSPTFSRLLAISIASDLRILSAGKRPYLHNNLIEFSFDIITYL